MATGYVLCLGDKTTCGGRIISGNPGRRAHSRPVARHGDIVTCGKHEGQYRITGGISFMTDVEGAERIPVAGTLDSVSGCPCRSGFIVTHYPAMKYESRSSGLTSSGGSPAVYGSMAGSGSALSSVAANAAKNVKTPVFAKSCLRGEGCNDAGQESEPHTNFARMAFYQAIPPADPASNYDVPQHAQSARKKKPAEDIPKPKKRSALYKWWFGNYEEVEYQRAAAAAASAANAQSALEGASVLGLIGGSAITSGTWAVSSATRLGAIAASGPGAPIAALLVGMMPGRLNEGEQDFIDRLRLEQMHEAPSRVRYTWENDSNSDAVPHGWHTPPGKDMVRVRKMEWDSSRNAYTFITEEDPRITIIWTPDSSGVNVPSNTGNHNPVRIPNPVVVDPLPEDTRIEATTTPAPEEKSFADYILILPIPDIPPIYVYLRNNPGQVTGKGQKVSGIWLSDANTGNGSPVPSQIADRLRGRTFENFDQFREAFWIEVSKDPELSRQFKGSNIINMKKGKAPATYREGRVGKRIKFEIHHIKPIGQGGEVYDVDNMGVATPRRHIDIHSNK
ncbi:S-type pyocin domain-containing protein [Erwinia sorbitola]